MKKMDPTNCRSDRPDEFKSLGSHRNKLLIHLQSSIEALATELQLVQVCEQLVVLEQVRFVKYTDRISVLPVGHSHQQGKETWS